VAVECGIKTGLVFVFGEITTNGYADIPKIVRKVVKRVGFTRAKYGFDYETCGVITSISEQSNEIAKGVKHNHEIGAGDQGMMFGYACDETPEFMPLPITLAHKLTSKLSTLRKDKTLPFLRPDGKSQVTVEYEDNKPKRIDTVVISTQHSPNITQEELKKELWNKIIKIELEKWIDQKTIFHCNPSGSFVEGGPKADAGLTGRKIIVDTYGGYCPHGGGAFSGKDSTKVDRSGAYATRYAAKNIVAAGLAKKCQIQVSYAIGLPDPVSILVETFGTGILPDQEIAKIAQEYFPFKPGEIIDYFDLKKPIFQKTAIGGHFGRSEFAWEKTDLAEKLRQKFN
jgi:S-adenosylmethionine synthetase